MSPEELKLLQDLAAEMRAKKSRWQHERGSLDVVYADKVDDWADELDAVLVRAAPPDDKLIADLRAAGYPMHYAKAAPPAAEPAWQSDDLHGFGHAAEPATKVKSPNCSVGEHAKCPGDFAAWDCECLCHGPSPPAGEAQEPT